MAEGYLWNYSYVAIFLLVGAVFVVIALVLSRLLAPHRPTPDKLETYESGEVPVGQAWVQFPVHFYIFALLFVVFDVEIIFLVAWATIFQSLGLLGLAEMMMFLGVLVAGLLYAWKKGVLQWL